MVTSNKQDTQETPAKQGPENSAPAYEPKREVNLLLLRADGRPGLFIPRFGQGGFMFATPEEFYEASQEGVEPGEFYGAIEQKRQGELLQ